MTNKQDGGPAFPLATSSGSNESVNGMSLRDWFAGQALAGMCANPSCDSRSFRECAEYSYKHADEMLVARSGQ